MRRFLRMLPCSAAVAVALGMGAAPGRAQIPDTFVNLQYFDEDITRDSLLSVMRGFSFGLGVRCQYCHVGGDGISFEGVEFDRDDDPDKRKARFMLRLVENLNRQVLPLVPERDEPVVRMECKTCHRGQPRPLLLTQELQIVLDAYGADSAIARYRELRATEAMSGAFDFGEWEMNVMAERLADAGRYGEASAIYRLNLEYFPESISILLALGQLAERLGNVEEAIRRYERVLQLRPNHRGAEERLAQIRR